MMNKMAVGRMRRSVIAAGWGVAGSVVGLTRCGAGTAAGPGGADGAAGVPALRRARVTLRLNARAGSDEALWQHLAPSFAAQFPNVGVEVETFPGSFTEYLQKVTVLAASGQLGDVLYNTTTSGLFDVLVAAKLLRPIDDLVRADKYDLKVFYRAGTDLLTREGKLYGLPNTCQPGSVVVYFNKEMLQRDGAMLPSWETTPDEVVAAARRVTKPAGAGDVWGYVPDLSPTGVLATIQAFGGRWLSKDGKRSELNTPSTRQALTYVADLMHRHKVAPPPGTTLTGGARTAFLAGKVGMLVGSTGDANVLALATDVSIGATLLPRVRRDLPRGIMRVDAWSVTTGAKAPREAWEVCKFIAGPEGSLLRADVAGGSGTLGCTPAAWTNPEVARKRGELQGAYVRALNEAEVNILAANYRNDEYQQLMGQKLTPLWAGETQVTDALMLDLHQAVQVVLEKPPAG